MTSSTTLTIRLPATVKAKLGRLAEGTKRTRSFLAAEAIESYVDQEMAIIEGIERARKDVKAGRVVPHDQAMRRIYATIDRVEKEKRKR